MQKVFTANFVAVTLLLVPIFSVADHFQDSNGLIIIRSDTEEFQCPASEFSAYEATYEAPANGAIRIWNEAYQALQKDGTQYGDPFFSQTRFDAYVANISEYQAAYDAAHTPADPYPSIYVDVALDKSILDIDDPSDKIQFQGTLKDGQGNTLDVTQAWIIRLRNATGAEVDAIHVPFISGVTPQKNYTAPPNIQCGRIHIDEADFDLVEIPGVGTFQVKLSSPVEITIYRQL